MDMFFFFNDTATTEIYTLSLHDALPISARPERLQRGDAGRSVRRLRCGRRGFRGARARAAWPWTRLLDGGRSHRVRSEEHTSELQSQSNLVCRLLLEKKKDETQHCQGKH